ncbi:MFS transporter [Paraburkholderia sp. 1N]|uniref:MFS transporter n=2 Tax=Paraburkholderia solitsugae TaxID=2675748 RepID=A0ABX2BQU0_9BURK|nr:MFS transporter [Paraburkholderia solitsugae]NPT42203.1 MFS transporter [Paraburkholderia solitsugae]
MSSTHDAIGPPVGASDTSQIRAIKANETTGMIGARLDRLPVSRSVWMLVLVISLGGFFEFYELFSTAYIAPGIIRSGVLTATTRSFLSMSGIASFIAAAFTGLLVGTLFFGAIADKFGRRSVFTFALLWYTVSAAIMAFQTTALGLNFWRFMVGIGLGVELVTIDSYLSEIVPKHIRGRAFAFNQFITYLAVPVIACLAWQLVPLTPFGLDGWRWVVLLGSVGAVVIWVIRRRIPESPRWLAAHGEPEKAERIVAELERRAERETGLPLPVPEATSGEVVETGQLREIFSRAFLSRTVMLSIFHVFQTIGLYGFSNWVPSFLIKQGFEVTTSLAYTLGITLVMPCGPLIALLYGDRFERKWQIVASSILVAGAGLLFAEARNPVFIVTTGALVTLGATTMSYNFHAYQSELYPTRIRARAIGFVYSWSRLSGIFSGFLVSYALNRAGVSGALLLIAASMGMVALSIAVLGPSTKGRSLESLTT